MKERGGGVMTDDEKWRSAVAALSGLLSGMVDTFIARILQDPVYSESGLTIEDIRRSSHDSLVAMLAVLQDGGTDMEALESIAAELGKRRARQGLPLDSLVRAIRLDFSVLWDALSASSLAVDPALLVSRTELVWRTVDTFASRVQERYIAELEDIERANADLEHQYLSQLMAPGEPSESDLARIAGALRVDVGARFVVVAVSREDSLTVQRRLRHRAKKMEALFTFDQGHHTLVIHRRGQSHAQLGDTLAREESTLFDGMAVAVAPLAEGLGSVRTSAAAAREIMRDLPMGSVGVFTLKDRWLSITRHRLSQLGCDPGQLVFPKLQGCAPQERARILEAATTFLGTGSLVETARKLFCHRNTVVNRLAAFERYTGLDLQNPTDLSLAVLALRDATADP